MAEAKQRDPSVRRRRSVTAGAAVLMMAAAGAAEALSSHDGHWRLVDWVRIAAVLFLALVLSLRSTTGFTLRPRNPALDDELTRANRASAAAWGFWALFVSLVAVFAANWVWPLGIAETVPIIVVIGAAAASLRFVYLERQGE